MTVAFVLGPQATTTSQGLRLSEPLALMGFSEEIKPYHML